MCLLDEAALLHETQMTAHRGRRQPERIGEFSRPPRTLAEKLHSPTTMGIGERRKRLVDPRAQSSRFFVTKPLALSHSSEVIFRTVTPKVQIWPSGSFAR